MVAKLGYGRRDRSRITACEMRDCVRNEQVLEECGVKENVVQKVGKSALRWFGHVERMKDEELLKRVYGWEAWQGEAEKVLVAASGWVFERTKDDESEEECKKVC